MGYVFDEDTAVSESGEGVFQGFVDPGWSISGNPNGGYLLSIVTSAIDRLIEHPDPLSMTTHYLRPGLPGEPCEVHVDVIRKGRTLTTLRACLIQDGKERLVCLGAYGNLEDSMGVDSDITLEPPDLPPPEECIERDGRLQGIELEMISKLEVMLDPVQANPQQSGIPEISGWIRFRDGRSPDTRSMLLFCDTFPPSPFGKLGVIGWVPTVELTTHVRRKPASGWIKGRFRTDDLQEGRMIESGGLWDSEGSLVATCRQIGLVFRNET